MLSPKARAFCVENLLGLSPAQGSRDADLQTSEKANEKIYFPVPTHGQNICNSLQTVYDDSSTKRISVELLHNDLWHSFHNLTTEMIITKSGRRMFPAVRVRIRGLDPQSKYRVYMDFMQLDHNKYRYVYHSSKWMISGTGDSMIPNQYYNHPDSPMDSNFINSQIISFERIKLTNNDKLKPGQVSLMSMQRFQPRIHIEEICEKMNRCAEHFVATFPQTAFIAVTAYQNQEITRLKIARNPFAKGFREAGKNRSSLEAMMEFYGLQIHNAEIVGKELSKRIPERTSEEDHGDKRKIKRFCHDRVCKYDEITSQASHEHVVQTDNIYPRLPFEIKTEARYLPYCNSGMELNFVYNTPKVCDSSKESKNISCTASTCPVIFPDVMSLSSMRTIPCKQEIETNQQSDHLSKQLQIGNDGCCDYVVQNKIISFSYSG